MTIIKYLVTILFLVYPVAAGTKKYGDYEYFTGSSDNFDLSEMISLLNRARSERQVTPLQFDIRLECAAKSHCEKMAKINRFGHNVGNGEPSNRASECGFKWRSVRENLYRDSFQGKTSQAHNALMKSPGHYRNIVAGEIDRVGVAICQSDKNTYWVQVFGKEMDDTGNKFLVFPRHSPESSPLTPLPPSTLPEKKDEETQIGDLETNKKIPENKEESLDQHKQKTLPYTSSAVEYSKPEHQMQKTGFCHSKYKRSDTLYRRKHD